MKKLRIKDRMFSHAEYSTDYQKSKYVIWDRNSNDNTCFYTEYSFNELDLSIKNNYAWLIESPEITKNQYDWISKNWLLFKKVFTHNKRLLETCENGVLVLLGGCWIKPEDQKVYTKSKLLSTIASPKKMTKSQRMRHDIINKYVDKIDLYGRGYNPIEYKLTGLRDYMFSITLENTSEDYYFTEKLIDCFMTGTIPIYYGCPSIGDFFNMKGMIIFNDVDELDWILKNIDKVEYYRRLEYVKENFEKAKRYLITEDVLWEKIKEDYEL